MIFYEITLWRVLADNEKARLKVQPCFDYL